MHSYHACACNSWLTWCHPSVLQTLRPLRDVFDPGFVPWCIPHVFIAVSICGKSVFESLPVLNKIVSTPCSFQPLIEVQPSEVSFSVHL